MWWSESWVTEARARDLKVEACKLRLVGERYDAWQVESQAAQAFALAARQRAELAAWFFMAFIWGVIASVALVLTLALAA